MKISLKSILRVDNEHAKLFRPIFAAAIDQYNKIGVYAMGLANYHFLRLFKEYGEEPFKPDSNGKIKLLERTEFRHCCIAVSRLNPNAKVPTSIAKKNPSLAESFEEYRGTFAPGHTFPHR